MHRIRNLAMIAALIFGLGACATESYYTAEALRRDGAHPRILMMPPDVELSEVDAGGSVDLNAQWTRQGTENLTQAVRASLNAMKIAFVEYTPPPDDTPEAASFDQVQKLHGAVGSTIRIFHMVRANRLPSMNGRFDWSLGPAAQSLAAYADADYALFVYVRDSYATPGRKALIVAAALLTGAHVTSGIQLGHASLVDLKTGQVVWFNALHAREDGDLRTAADAGETVAMLLDKLPK